MFEERDCGYETPCWIWLQVPMSAGYGLVTRDGVRMLAHRAFYEDHYGPIPKNSQLDHLCKIRQCVNPEHLEPVTQAVNTQRGRSAKLTKDQVTQIRALRGQMPQGRIAKLFGVSRVHVVNLHAGHYWEGV